METVLKCCRSQSNRNFVKFSRHILNVSAVSLFLLGLCLPDRLKFSFMLFGVVAMWLSNIIFSLENLKSRVLFLFFNLTQFIFLMGRGVVNFFKEERWWKLYTDTGLNFALTALFFSLLCMPLGVVLFEFAERKSQKIRQRKVRPNSPLLPKHSGYIADVSLLFFLLCFFCFMYIEVDKLIFMQGKAYEDYYILYKSNPPPLFGTFSAMMPYSLCVYLATFPKKSRAFVVLMMYFVSAIPMLIIGQRNPIVLNAIFVFIYYFIRGTFDNKEKWLGRFEKTALVISIPLAVLLLSMYNYTRGGKSVELNIFGLLIDFVEKQGVSFKVLCLGFDAIPKIINTPFTNYTFGPIIDYWYYGAVGQTFLGAPDLGVGNNEFRATHGNDFSHSMSYIAKEDYLQGHGWGSSYLLETYADFGWLGVIIFSLLLGMIFVFLLKMLRRGVVASSITLVALAELFFTPRSNATGWILFLFQPHFWIAVFLCIMSAQLLYNSSQKQKYRVYSEVKINV